MRIQSSLVLEAGLMFISEWVSWILSIACCFLKVPWLLIYCIFVVLLFQGRSESPATSEVELSTAPSAENPTHWGQQVSIVKHIESQCSSLELCIYLYHFEESGQFRHFTISRSKFHLDILSVSPSYDFLASLRTCLLWPVLAYDGYLLAFLWKEETERSKRNFLDWSCFCTLY